MTDVIDAKRGPGRPRRDDAPMLETAARKLDTSVWLHLDDAPQDGKSIVLTDATRQERSVAVWRNTRHFDRKSAKWVSGGFWAKALTAGSPITFEPDAWRPKIGFNDDL